MKHVYLFFTIALCLGTAVVRAQGVNINETANPVTPSALFTVGVNEGFRVNTAGNLIRINGVPYSWPATQATGVGFLRNNGSGVLSWVTGLGNGVTVTDEGGIAVNLVNGSGAMIPKGTLVMVNPSGSATNQIIPHVLYGDYIPLGVAAADIPNNSSGPITIAGIAEVLTEGTITMGMTGFPGSITAGRVAGTSNANTGEHWGEVGHFVTTPSGTPPRAKLVLHFN